MAELRLKSYQFRREREATGGSSRAARPRREARRQDARRRRAGAAAAASTARRCRSLSVARSISLDPTLIDYLESLAAAPISLVYGARTNSVGGASATSSSGDWPRGGAPAQGRETLVSLFALLAGRARRLRADAANPDWYYTFVPRGPGRRPRRRRPRPNTCARRCTTSDAGRRDRALVLRHLPVHPQRQIGILAFALGFAFGLPTVLLLVQNGLHAGRVLALYASRGLGIESAGWLSSTASPSCSPSSCAAPAGWRSAAPWPFPARTAGWRTWPRPAGRRRRS